MNSRVTVSDVPSHWEKKKKQGTPDHRLPVLKLNRPKHAHYHFLASRGVREERLILNHFYCSDYYIFGEILSVLVG